MHWNDATIWHVIWSFMFVGITLELISIRRVLERTEKHSDFLLCDIKRILEKIEKKLDR